MNPTLRERVNVIIVPLGTVDWKNRINANALVKAYISELLIVTNEPERFQGALKCHEGFVITRPPQVEPTGNAFETGPSVEPKMIATNEYEIGVRALGQEWGPSHPAYMQVKYFERGLGPCAFTQEE